VISSRTLSIALQALATGLPDRALELIATTDELNGQPKLRDTLRSAIENNKQPVDQAIALGEMLSDAAAAQFLVDECCRCAFYLGADWQADTTIAPDATPGQSPEDPIEELRLARGELRRLRRELATTTARLDTQAAELESTRYQLNESWRLVKDMRTSLSWRITAPLRAPIRPRKNR
jgi:hypothetical protein